MAVIKNVVFDLGGVLIDWNPRYLYRKVFADAAAMEDFLATVCNDEWNIQQDAGRTLAEGTAILSEQFPQHAHLIRLFYERWHEMLAGPIHETVAILKQLQNQGLNLYALTNWSHETFPYARQHYNFLENFIDIVVSGEEKIVKPDPRIFQILLERNNLTASESLFIDDNLRNVAAAKELGMETIRFQTPLMLESSLLTLGLLDRIR